MSVKKPARVRPKQTEAVNIGDDVVIYIQLGLDTHAVNAKVVRYLGNGEYTVEADNGNHYIRKLERKPATEAHVGLKGIDAAKAEIMQLTDLEIEKLINFCAEQLRIMH